MIALKQEPSDNTAIHGNGRMTHNLSVTKQPLDASEPALVNNRSQVILSSFEEVGINIKYIVLIYRVYWTN